MEGNACYKLSTISNFITATKSKNIQTIVDAGANVGAISLLMHDYFREA
jgi:tRNA1(Val) A37 N6-methylase TrmN6